MIESNQNVSKEKKLFIQEQEEIKQQETNQIELQQYKDFKIIDLEQQNNFQENINDFFKNEKDYLLKNISISQAILSKVPQALIQSVSDPSISFYSIQRNIFAEMFRISYAYHIPLALSPDQVWLQILQGFSIHVEQNSESLRKYFVNFEGKETISIIRDDFVFGEQKNDWRSAFNEICQQIKIRIGEETYNSLANVNFSTTGELEKSLYALTLMDSMKSYFIFEVYTRCGVPKVKLQGKREDWVQLIEYTKYLKKFELEWWIDKLLPILEKFLKAYDGEIDQSFWNCCYKVHQKNMSGATKNVNGWISNFFPYLEKKKQMDLPDLQTYLQNINNPDYQKILKGQSQDKIPPGISQTPFIWKYCGEAINMEILGGFCGFTLKDDFITPVLGWAVSKYQEVVKEVYDDDFY